MPEYTSDVAPGIYHSGTYPSNAESSSSADAPSTIQSNPPDSSACPILLLPVEILQDIFTLCQSDKNHAFPSERSWLNVTHVCAHFRAISLNQSSLWTQLAFAYPKWAMVMLKRSYPSLIEVSASSYISSFYGPSPIQKLLRWILRYRTKRIRKLIITDMTQLSFTYFFGRIKPTDMGQLRTLFFESLDNGSVKDLNALNQIFLSPLNLEEVDLPHLPGHRWDTSILACTARLTHLVLAEYGSTGLVEDRRPVGGDLFSVLSRSPGLERLVLANVLLPTVSSGFAQNIRPTIDLPHLGFVKLIDGVDKILNVMQRISFPPTTRIFLEIHPSLESTPFTTSPGTNSDVPLFRSLCTSLLRNPSSYHAISIHASDSTSLINAWKFSPCLSRWDDNGVATPATDKLGDPSLTIELKQHDSLILVSQTIPEICRSLPLQDLLQATLQSTIAFVIPNMDLRKVAEILSGLGKLKIVDARGEAAAPVVDMVEKGLEKVTERLAAVERAMDEWDENDFKHKIQEWRDNNPVEVVPPFRALQTLKVNGRVLFNNIHRSYVV